jgi:monovalent cation:H+ antiporter, CPA1 family
MYYYYLFGALIIITTIFTYINHQFVKLPAPIAVTIFSLITSIVLLIIKSVFPQLTTSIQESVDAVDFKFLVMDVLLGFLLFAGSFKLNFAELKKEAKPILSLSVISTLISTFVVGYLIYFFLRFINYPIPLIYCLLFGSLISPTDPLAALSILRKAGIPKSFELKVTGESLLNDGIAIVIFTTIYEVASSSQSFSFLHTVLLFLREAGGGFLFGLTIGYGGFFLLKTIDNYKVEILITVVIAMAGYALANMLHVSGPLAMVVAGLLTGGQRKKQIMTNESEKFVTIFWDITDDFLNVILFLLIGFEMLVIHLHTSIIYIAAVAIVILLFARFISVLLPVALLRKQFEKHAIAMLTWGGLRGALSIALALTLPIKMYRNEILAITYFIAVFSIVVQGLTIGRLARKLGTGHGEATITVEEETKIK